MIPAHPSPQTTASTMRIQYTLHMIGGCFNGQTSVEVELVKVSGDFISSDEYKLRNQGNSKHGYTVTLEEGWGWQMLSQDHIGHVLP